MQTNTYIEIHLNIIPIYIIEHIKNMSCIISSNLLSSLGVSSFLDQDFNDAGISAVDFIIPPNLPESLFYIPLMFAGLQACRILYFM